MPPHPSLIRDQNLVITFLSLRDIQSISSLSLFPFFLSVLPLTIFPFYFYLISICIFFFSFHLFYLSLFLSDYLVFNSVILTSSTDPSTQTKRGIQTHIQVKAQQGPGHIPPYLSVYFLFISLLYSFIVRIVVFLFNSTLLSLFVYFPQSLSLSFSLSLFVRLPFRNRFRSLSQN